MHKRKNVLAVLTGLLCVIVMLSGCIFRSDSTLSIVGYVYPGHNGDSIKIQLDTTNEYNLSSDSPFVITHNDKEETQGTFISREVYKQFVTVAEQDPNAKLLDSGEKDGNSYVFWSYDGKEFNYAIMVEGSHTGVFLRNLVSAESATACFERITISEADPAAETAPTAETEQ